MSEEQDKERPVGEQPAPKKPRPAPRAARVPNGRGGWVVFAVIAAYNSWEWAFLVCQNESKWTLAVWMYQMSQQMGGQPWCVMAGFVLVSIPTAIVFLACQKVILRGIVLPSMK